MSDAASDAEGVVASDLDNRPERSSVPSRVRPGWVVAGVSVVSMVAIFVFAGWWGASPSRPPMELLIDSPSARVDDTDVEQLAFSTRRTAPPRKPAEPPAGAPSPIDYAWVERLSGRWLLDLGNRALPVTFGGVSVKQLPGELLTLDLFPVSGLGLPPYFTVLKRSEGQSFLAFQNESGEYVGLLDDLKAHGDDLISYRLGGTAIRRYGHRSGHTEDRFAGPFGTPPSDLREPEPRERDDIRRRDVAEPIEIIVERRSEKELWQRAKQLKQNGRLDSLELAIDRLLASYPKHRKARRWRRSLANWRSQQRRSLRSRLNQHLDQLEEAVEDQDLGDLLELWLPGARPTTRGTFSRLFDDFNRTRVRIQLKDFEIDDGTLIFDAAFTLEGFDGRQRSIEAHTWRGRLHGEHFLDPFPG